VRPTSQASCFGKTSLMFSDDPADQGEAKRLCATCPAIVRCGLAAIKRHERFGIWGGWTSAEREALVKGARRRAG